MLHRENPGFIASLAAKIVKCDDVNSNEETSTGLIRRAAADDDVAWRQLVQTYGRRVYRWCRRAGLQPADASNVAQEVLRSIARKLGDFHHDREGDTFRGWIRRITQNKLRDHFRSQSRHVDQATGGTDAQQRLVNVAELRSGDTESSFALAWGGSLRADLREAVTKLRAEISQRDWQLFWRVVVDGQSAVDAGQEFGLSGNAVRLVKMRVLRRLRELAGTSDA